MSSFYGAESPTAHNQSRESMGKQKNTPRKQHQPAQRVQDHARVSAGFPERAWLLALPFLVLAVLRIVAAFYPEARVWGLHVLAYLPPWLAVVFGVAGLVLASPLLYNVFAWISHFVFAEDARVRTWTWAMLATLVGGAVFWVFRMETFFLGDGAVYLSEIYRFTSGAAFAKDVLYSTGSAPLTGWLIAQFASFLRGLASHPDSLFLYSQAAFWFSAAIAGMVYICLAVVSARALFANAELRFGYLILLLATPVSLFFFGYVEYYTLFFVTGLAYFTTLALAVRNRISVVWPVVTLVLMCALHIMGLLAIPSIILLIAARHGGTKGARLTTPVMVFSGIAAVLLLAGVYYVASGIAWEGSRVALAVRPFGQEGAVQHYTLLSSWHLIDVVNLLFLLGAPAIVLLAYVPWREQVRDVETLIALTNLLFFSCLMFFGYTCFGMARDWDVNALWSLAVLFVLAAVLRDTRSARWRYRMQLAAGAALGATIPWIIVNVSTDSAVERFRHIMALDDKHVTGDFALNGYEHLRKHYQNVADTTSMMWAIGKKIEMVGYRSDYTAWLGQAVALRENKASLEAFDFAIGQLRATIDTMQRRGVDSVYAGSRSDMFERYYDYVLAAHARFAGTEYVPTYIDIQMEWLRKRAGGSPMFTMLESYLQPTRVQNSVTKGLLMAAANELYQSPRIAIGLASTMITIGEIEATVDVLQRSLTRNPEALLVAYYLADAQLRLQPPRIQDAEAHIRAILARPSGLNVPNEVERSRIVNWATQTLREIERRRE